MVDHAWEVWWSRHKYHILWLLGATLIILITVRLIWHPGQRTVRALGIIGFYENNTAQTHSGSLSALSAHIQKLTTVSPQWFSVNGNGSVTDTGYDPPAANLILKHHVALVPLFINTGGNSQVVLNPLARIHAVDTLVHMVQQYHLNGVDIDFELLKPAARNGLSLFIKLLARKFRPMHKTIAVCVFPLVGVPSSVNAAYDYRNLAANANYLVMMTYDHHYSGGIPGPVAPFSWVKDNITAALRQVRAHQIVLAIGMYGYDWVDNGKPGPAATVPDAAVANLLHRYGVRAQYNAFDSQNQFTYIRSGVKHIVYYMGTRSAEARLQLARRYHLAGISLWRLGFEEPGFWSVVPGK